MADNPYLDPTLMQGLQEFTPKQNEQFLSSHKIEKKTDNDSPVDKEKLKSKQENILNKINELKSRLDQETLKFRQENILNRIDDLQLQINDFKHAQKLKTRQETILNQINTLQTRLYNIQHPIISLSQFFVSNDFAPGYTTPFNWPKFEPLNSNINILSLIRSSCKTLSENAKFIEINYNYIEKYAQLLDKKEINNLFVGSTWNMEQKDEIKLDTERDIINVSCYFIMLQFGSGYRKILHKYCSGRGASLTIGVGIQNMFKKYPHMNCKVLNGINIKEISQLFDIDYSKNDVLKSFCDLIRKCIQETVDVLDLNNCNDFADYIYKKINEAWIHHQIKISGTKIRHLVDVEFDVAQDKPSLGLELAPTKSDIVRRTVVIGVDESNLDLKYSILYKMDNEIVYDKPFEYIIKKINTLKNDKNIKKINISFGNNTNTQPNIARYLLVNLVNDFSSLNDKYLYKNKFKDDTMVYLFKRAQLMIMDLYNNLHVKNKYFNFNDINNLCSAIDNVVPFVLMKDNVIKVKDIYKKEFDKYINSGNYVLLSGDLEAEIRGIALYAIELILKKRKKNDFLNIASLTYYLWKKGKFDGYRQCERHYTRDTVFY
eukprot:61313_1